MKNSTPKPPDNDNRVNPPIDGPFDFGETQYRLTIEAQVKRLADILERLAPTFERIAAALEKQS